MRKLFGPYPVVVLAACVLLLCPIPAAARVKERLATLAASPTSESVDGATLARLRVQKKTWRSRLALKDRDRRIAIVVVSFLGVAVEHLMQRLDYLGERKKGLFDLPFPDLSPFVVCQRFICHALAQGFRKGAPLGTFVSSFLRWRTWGHK